MSNINSSEPQAFGLILFKTTFGELELELFTKQCPKITRNFVQLCLDGYYKDTIFDRVEKDFIAIGGKLGTGKAIESEMYPDEFHSRLKFSRRGLVATANTDKDSNGPEFFLTLGPAPELQNKHSIFGRLKGNSVYHLVDLNECPVDDDLVPISEKRILEVIIEENPFPELEPRPEIVHDLERLRDKPTREVEKDQDYLEPILDIKSSSKKLSFYQEESDEEEEEDEKLVASDNLSNSKEDVKARASSQDDKFKKPSPRSSPNGHSSEQKLETNGSVQKLSEQAREKRLREIREQIQDIKKQIENESVNKIRTLAERRNSQDRDSSLADSMRSTSSKQSSVEDPDLSSQELRLASKKGRHRERETLELLENFKKKLKQTAELNRSKQSVSSTSPSNKPDKMHEINHDDDEASLAEALELVDGDAWLRHKFDAVDDGPRNAKDANQRGDDWYSIEDPRNPVVQRVEAEKANEFRKHRSRSDLDKDDRDRRHSRSHSKERRHRHSGRSSYHEHRR